MIPEITINNDQLDSTEQPSLTWKLDFDSGRIAGKIDDLEALRQSVFKILQTERFWHDIYSFDYGHELTALLGSSSLIAESETKRMVTEALLQDDRVREAQWIDSDITNDYLTVRFRVKTDYGSFDTEVRRNV